MAVELDDGGTGYGPSRATSAPEALVANVSGRGGHRASAKGRKRRCRADARRAVVTPALWTGLVRGSWRDRCSARLSVPSAVFGPEVGALAWETSSAPATRTPAVRDGRIGSGSHPGTARVLNHLT
jgi:hypothetical protein